MLIDRIIRAKHGDQEEMAALLQQFSPLLRKWGGKLLGEDGIEEMTLAFLEIIQAIEPKRFRCQEDGTVVSYLAQSVRNAYVQRQKQFFRQPDIGFSLDSAEEADEDPMIGREDPSGDRNFFDLLEWCPNLTEKEQQVLTYIYYWGYSATEIAATWNTSKQNIHQIKQRGLRKLRSWLTEKT